MTAPSIVRPVLIVGAPRSGTTILHRCLAVHPDVWHLAAESHGILEGPFHPFRHGYASNRVTAGDVDDGLARELRRAFYDEAINLNRMVRDPGPLLRGRGPVRRVLGRLALETTGRLSRLRKPRAIRLLEKTPKNALRIPMLDVLFPDGLFVWIRRRAATNIDSLITAWLLPESFGGRIRPRFARAGYSIAEDLGLRDYGGRWWRFVLVPGWQELRGATVGQVAARQYHDCNAQIRSDLGSIEPGRVISVTFEQLLATPVATVRSILDWADLSPSPVVDSFAHRLPRVNDATPRGMRAKGEIRYPGRVREGLAFCPNIRALEKEMAVEMEGAAVPSVSVGTG